MSTHRERVSWRLADWAAGVSPRDIPARIRMRANTCLMDTIGVAIAGTRSGAASLARAVCLDGAAQGWSTAFGADRQVSAQAAAFINGTAAHALDFDDNCYAGFVHGSAVVAPAALAVGQKMNGMGADAITAFIVGVECEYAVGAATMNVLYDRGWWTTGVLGPIGSSMAAARLLGLDAARTHAALGLAVVNASGMKSCFGSDAKALMAGRASELGVVCAELAARGAIGPEHPFSDKNGFINLFNEGRFDDSGFAAMGEKWYMESPGVDIKRIPVCLSSHAAVDVTQELVSMHNLRVSEIQSIVCDVPPIVRANLKYDTPRTPREAQFSMPFALASSLLFQSLSLSLLNDETLENQALRALMARITMTSGPMWDSPDKHRSAPEGAEVRIQMRDGASFEAFRDKALGSAAHPLSDKFLACVAPVLGDRRAGILLSDIKQLDGPMLLRDIFRDANFGVLT